MNTNTHTFKLVVIGDGGVGKTTYLKRMITGEFEQKYVPTLGVETHRMHFTTNSNQFRNLIFNAWDCAGQEKLGGLQEGYFHGADCALIFFDRTSKSSFQNVENWLQLLRNVRPGTPVLLVGNKNDVPVADIKVLIDDIQALQEKYNLPYYSISAKSLYNFEKPFLYLARELTGDANLVFAE